MERPVSADELEAVAKAQGVTIGAGDALLVYCGLESMSRRRDATALSPSRDRD